MGLQFRHERTDLYRKGGRSNNRECFCCPRISSRPPLLTHKAFLMTKNSNKTLKSISAFVNGELCFVTMSLLFLSSFARIGKPAALKPWFFRFVCSEKCLFPFSPAQNGLPTHWDGRTVTDTDDAQIIPFVP